MSNRLFDNGKAVEARSGESDVARAENGADISDFKNTTIGAYSPAAMNPSNYSRESWENSSPKAWTSTLGGRIAIRAFSRGILGCAFFAAGSHLTSKWMVQQTYNGEKALLEQWKPLSKEGNPLHFIAKLIDSTAGEGIKNTVRVLGYGELAAERAVRFRPTKFKESGLVQGRSLGHEAVGITFDFFCASIGDAWGRDIVGWFDPAVKKEWIRDDGSIDAPKALQTALKSTAQYLTYNGGEDWAVAIPYAYYMRASRKILNHTSPGFENDPDRNLNGGSFRVGRRGGVLGNFNEAGIVDLQGRFTVYNIGTLMYREVYNHIKDTLQGKQSSLYGAPDKKEKIGILGNIGKLCKWVARSAVKGAIYMTPAVPFFWISRTPQTKYRGSFILPNHGTLTYKDANGKFQVLKANENALPAGTEVFFSRYDPHREHFNPEKGIINNFTPDTGAYRSGDYVHSFHSDISTLGDVSRVGRKVSEGGFDPYGKTFGPIDWTLNEVGKVNYEAGNVAENIAKKYDDRGLGKSIKSGLGVKTLANPARTFMNAAFAYTPYMIAKSEFARMFDDGQMDMAAERMIDGASAFNWNEFKAGLGEVRDSILHRPLADPERIAEGHRRINLDGSPSAGVNIDNQNLQEQHKLQNILHGSWKNRVISGKPEEEKMQQSSATSKPSESHTEQEELRKALRDLRPPTPSVH